MHRRAKLQEHPVFPGYCTKTLQSVSTKQRCILVRILQYVPCASVCLDCLNYLVQVDLAEVLKNIEESATVKKSLE